MSIKVVNRICAFFGFIKPLFFGVQKAMARLTKTYQS